MDVVRRLALDLRTEFPGVTGFSAQNLWRRVQFSRELTSPEFLRAAAVLSPGGKTSDPEKLSQAVREMAAQVPWGHYANILARVENPDEKFYYLQATAQYGWSRNILLNQVKSQAYARSKLKELNDFRTTLSPRPGRSGGGSDEKLLQPGVFGHPKGGPRAGAGGPPRPPASKTSSSNWAMASASLAASTGWRCTARNTSSTCSSTTAGCAP